MLDYLSGNVPGGFGLYLLFVVVAFLVLFGMSRRNDLFTPRLFRIWFAGIWALATVIYAAVWLSAPPAGAFTRYSVQFYAENAEDHWLSLYLRDGAEALVTPARTATDYHYPQRWNHLTDRTCDTFDNTVCENIASQLPFDLLALGRIHRENGQLVLKIELRTYPGGDVAATKRFQLNRHQPEAVWAPLRSWLGTHLPIQGDKVRMPSADSLLTEVRELFYSEAYDVAGELFRKAPQNRQTDPDYRRWMFYLQIRQAAELRRQTPAGNPFDSGLARWQQQLREAQAFLIPLARDQFAEGMEDPLLSNMVAESFIQEEKFGDAEQFLKVAFGENPFMMEVLQNLLLLHSSRYGELPFSDDKALMRQILNVCPFNQPVLREYVEKLLANLQVNRQPEGEIRQRIERALSLNPEAFTAQILKSKFYLMQFEFDTARAALTAADNISPDQAITHYNFGILDYQQKKSTEAERHFQKAVEISDFLDAHVYLGVIHQERGEYRKALEYFQYRVKNKTGDDDYYALQAMKGIRECREQLGMPLAPNNN